MIFEWYSGSDPSGVVPRALNEYERRASCSLPDGFPLEERIEDLSGILKIEQDPNWRANLLCAIGVACLDAGDDAAAEANYVQALHLFDTLAGNFRDVQDAYAYCHYELLRIFNSAGKDWYHLAIGLLPFLPDLDLSEGDMMVVYSFVGDALYDIANATDSVVLFRAAQECHTAAFLLRSEIPNVLASLIYAAYGAGDLETSRRTWERFKELSPPSENFGELRRFAAEAL